MAIAVCWHDDGSLVSPRSGREAQLKFELAASLVPHEIRQLLRTIARCWLALGGINVFWLVAGMVRRPSMRWEN